MPALVGTIYIDFQDSNIMLNLAQCTKQEALTSQTHYPDLHDQKWISIYNWCCRAALVNTGSHVQKDNGSWALHHLTTVNVHSRHKDGMLKYTSCVTAC